MRGDSDGKDELYTEWFKCTECGATDMTSSSNFCPHCGEPADPAKLRGRYQLRCEDVATRLVAHRERIRSTGVRYGFAEAVEVCIQELRRA